MKTCKKKRRRAIGSFETMEDRKLFAVDLIGVGDLGGSDAEALSRAEMDQLYMEPRDLPPGDYGKPNPEEDGPLGPIGPVVQNIEQITSESVVSELAKPNPEDDDPPGPIGPVVQVAEQLQANDLLVGAGMPAPDDDDPPGPIGPVYREAIDWLANGLIDPQIESQVGDLQTIIKNDPAEKPEPETECNTVPWPAACDVKAPELDPERWSNAGDTDGDGDSDFADFLNLSSNFGKHDALRSEGDLNGDSVVSFGDFLILSSNFGTSIPPAAADAVFA